jgi:tryptophan-rich sensory protein
MKKRAKRSGKRKAARVKKANRLIKSPKILIYSALAVIAAAFFGSRFTSVDSWYESVKPVITPPSYVFGIVWTILFILIAISMYLAISNSAGKARKLMINFFAVNLILNILWSALFFGMHLPVASFVDLLFLWATIMALIHISWKVSKASAWLLLPYAIWITFAGLLNYIIILA